MSTSVVKINWTGTKCSDGCPFYEVSVVVDAGVRFHSPRCRLSGRTNEDGKKFEIYPKLLGGGLYKDADRPDNCPFVDGPGVHVEVHNNA